MEKASEAKMRDAVLAVAGPMLGDENRKSWLSRAARHANVSYRQAKALFYGEIIDPEHKASRRMRDAAERKAKEEATDLAGRFETIAGALNAADADFYREDIASLVHVARALRGVTSARNDGNGDEY